jgi:DNA primase
MLTPTQREYLFGRGYIPLLIEEEGVLGVEDNSFFEGKPIRDCAGAIGWPVYSMSGEPVGLQTRELEIKKYRFHQLTNTEHLPLVFGTRRDWEILWETGSVILTEGTFDRVAIKRALPYRAVLARMSKGAPNQLRNLIRRYVTTLWLAFDMDEPGQDAAAEAETKLGSQINVYRMTFPAKDPSNLLQAVGLKKTTQILERQLNMEI